MLEISSLEMKSFVNFLEKKYSLKLIITSYFYIFLKK